MRVRFIYSTGFLLCLYAWGTSSPMGFDQALKKILERSSDIQIQETKVQGADYKVLGRKAAFLPNLSLSGQRGNTITDGDVAPASQSIGLSSTVNLLKWGADKNNLEASRSDLKAEQESLEDTRFKTEDLAVDVLCKEIEAEQKTEVLKKNAETFKSYLEIADQRFRRGLLASQEVDKVSLDYGNAQALLQDAQYAAAQAKADLERLLGSENIDNEWPWKGRLQTQGVATLMRTVPNIEARPDVRSLENLVNAENSRMKAGFDGEWPSLDLTGTVGTSQFEDGSQQVLTTGLTLSVPLFDRLANYSQYKVQYSNFAAADLKLRQLKLDAKAQWKASQEQFSIALATALSRDKNYKTSQSLYKTNENRFRQGRASANDLEVDHRRLNEAALLEIEGWSKAHAQFTRLCHALGRSVEHCEGS